MRPFAQVLGLAIAINAASAAQASGQAPPGLILNGSVTRDRDFKVSVAGSVGYRLNRGIALGTELTWTSLKFTIDDDVFPNVIVTYGDTSRDVLSFTTNFRFDIPTPVKRLQPFVVAGGGSANDTARYTRTATNRPDPARPLAPVTFVESEYRNSVTYLALVAGGGLGLLVTDRVSIDVDARALYLRSGQMALIRIGLGGSYRF